MHHSVDLSIASVDYAAGKMYILNDDWAISIAVSGYLSSVFTEDITYTLCLPFWFVYE